MRDAMKVIDRIGTIGRLMVAGIALVTIAAVAYLVMSAGPAAYVPAFTNLAPREAGEVQAALANAKIVSKLGAGGTSVLVPSSQVEAAAVAIGSAGLAVNGTHEGMSMLDNLGVGATEFQQNTTLERALEGELSNQVEEVSGVSRATVNLALPRRSLFLEDQDRATASVMLDLQGGAMPEESVRGIQRLVAGAVAGLTYASVTITNERGVLMTGTGNDGIGELAASRLSAEAAYARRLESKAQLLLDQMLGLGAGTVAINAQLDLDKVNLKTVEYGEEGPVIRRNNEVEKLSGSGGAAAGAAGTASNVPGYTAGSGSGSTTKFDHTKTDETTGIDQTVTTTERASGDPAHLFVALAFSPPKDAKGAAATSGRLTADQQAASDSVQALLGITKDDVDTGVHTFSATVSTTSIPDSATAAAATAQAVTGGGGGGPIAMAKGYARPAAIALGVILMLFLVRRSLGRRQQLLGSSQAGWMPALSAPPIPIDDIGLPEGPSQAQLEGMNKRQLQARVEELAQARPDDVAQQLRGWLAEDA